MNIKKYTFLLATGVTLLLFLFLNFGYFVATNWRSFLPKKAMPIVAKPEWKVYSNEKLKFELKYPPEWMVKENENTVEVNPLAEKNPYNYVYFTISLRNEFSSLAEVEEKLSSSTPLTPVEFGQLKGFKYLDGGSYEVIWFKNKDAIYVVRKYAASGESDKIFESLKFKE